MTRYTITVERTESSEQPPKLRLLGKNEAERFYETEYVAVTDDMKKLRAALHNKFDIALDAVGPPNG